MVDYRNILRLQSQGHSQREIERELYVAFEKLGMFL